MTNAAPAPPAATTTITARTRTTVPHTHTHTQVELAWRPAKTATQIFNADSTAYAIVTVALWVVQCEKCPEKVNTTNSVAILKKKLNFGK